MKIKATLSGKVTTFTNLDAVGYDVWRNVGSYDSRKKTAKYFNGSWFKDVLGEDGKPRTFDTPDDALKGILKLYNKAKSDKTNKEGDGE